MKACFAEFVPPWRDFPIILECALRPLPDLHSRHSHTLNVNPIIRSAYNHSSPHQQYKSHGILTVCPLAAAFAIALGPTNPSPIVVAKETLIFRRAGISPALWLLVPTFLLRNAPRRLTAATSSRMRTLSYQSTPLKRG